MVKREIRAQLKKLVIMGNHSGLTYDEALEEELYHGSMCGFYFLSAKKHCLPSRKPKINYIDGGVFTTDLGKVYRNNFYLSSNCLECNSDICTKEDEDITDKVQIVGLPITIGRVIQALNEKYKDSEINCFSMVEFKTVMSIWKFTEDGKECVDDDQTNEVILKLINLL